MINNSDILHEISIVNDNLFQETLFTANGQQHRIAYSKIKSMTTKNVVDELIDFYADSRPGWEGKMISTKLAKYLYTTIPKVIAQIP